MADPEELVTIYRAGSEAEGQLIKSLLDEEGIAATVADENSALAGLAIAGADVLVHQRDQKRALEFVADYEQRQIERAEADEDEDEDEEGDDDEEDDDEEDDDEEDEDEEDEDMSE